MATLTKLKRKRSTVRASLTKVIQTTEAELSTHEVNGTLLEEYMNQIEAKRDILTQLNLDIEEEIEELDELEEEVENSMVYEDKIISIRTRIKIRTETAGAMITSTMGRQSNEVCSTRTDATIS